MQSSYRYPSDFTKSSKPLVLAKRTKAEGEIPINDFVRPADVSDYLQKITESPAADEMTLRAIVGNVKNLPDRSDSKGDFWNFPKETIFAGGDCEDKVHLLVSLAVSAGFMDVYAVKGYHQKNVFTKKTGHVWAEAVINGIPYIIETLPEKTTFIKKTKSSGYFPYFKYNNKESFIY